ncbi:MAG: hypothetical protein ACE37K_13410 [Planctomycetota bacterium]
MDALLGMRVRLPALLAAFASIAAAQDLPRLVDDLGADDGRVRQRAYQELQRRKDPAIATLLAGRIETFPRGGQQFAIYLLRQLPIDATRKLYRDLAAEGPWFLRVAAAAELARKQQKGAAQRLVTVLAEVPERDRVSCTNHLYGLHDADVHEALFGWLHARAEAAVIRATLLHLERQGRTDAQRMQAAVEPLAAHADVGAKVAALAWLARVDRARADELAGLLQEDPKRFWPVRDLLDTDRPLGDALVEAIGTALREPRSRFDVTRTAQLLQRQSAGKAAEPLRALREHDKEDIRAAALEALAAIPGALREQDLQAMLRGDDLASVLVAADQLRRRDDVSGLAVVLDKVGAAGKHRAEAARVLGNFRDRRVAEPLLDMLDDANVQVRRNAWNGLQQVMRGLFPYRRFDFVNGSYRPDGGNRAGGIAELRRWWDAASKGQ